MAWRAAPVRRALPHSRLGELSTYRPAPEVGRRSTMSDTKPSAWRRRERSRDLTGLEPAEAGEIATALAATPRGWFGVRHGGPPSDFGSGSIRFRVPRADCEATRDALASLAKPSGVTKRGRSSAGLYLRPRAFARRGEGDPRMGILRLTVQGSETRGTDARDRCGPRTS